MSTEDQSKDSGPLEEVVETTENVEQEDIDLAVEEDEAQPELNNDSASEELLKAQEEIATLKDQAIRLQAEMQNLRRRVEKDVSNAHKFGQEKLIKELLPIVDNFERAIEAAPEGDDNPVLEGVKMTQSQMFSALEKFNVETINPMGEPFDPQLHQAMSMVENPLVEPNTVIAVMQRGYTLSGRLLRPAMVMVSKGGAEPTSVDEKA